MNLFGQTIKNHSKRFPKKLLFSEKLYFLSKKYFFRKPPILQRIQELRYSFEILIDEKANFICEKNNNIMARLLTRYFSI